MDQLRQSGPHMERQLGFNAKHANKADLRKEILKIKIRFKVSKVKGCQQSVRSKQKTRRCVEVVCSRPDRHCKCMKLTNGTKESHHVPLQ